MKITCQVCGHSWDYSGSSFRATCPKCKHGDPPTNTWVLTGLTNVKLSKENSAVSNVSKVKPIEIRKTVEVTDKKTEPVKKTIESEISPDGKKYIPDEFNYYARTIISKLTDINIFDDAMKNGEHVLLEGPTGSGKTALVRYWCGKNKRPYRRFSLNGGATVEDLVGHYVLVSGETVWVDGVLTQAMKYGWVLVADEINSAPPEVLFVLNSVLDDEKMITLMSKDGEVLHAHKDFRFVATCNPSEQGYAGTKEMNLALLDRFHKVLEIDYNTRVEEKIIRDMGFNGERKKDIITFVKSIREAYSKGMITFPFSTRSIINFCNMLQKDQHHLISFKFGADERKIVDDMIDIYIDKTKPLETEDNENEDDGGNY